MDQVMSVDSVSFPVLEKTEKSSVYDKYTKQQISQVVKGFLFINKSHRDLDEEVLGLDSTLSKGWETMAVLHHIGLRGKHKNFFSGYSLEEAVKMLEKQEMQPLVSILTVDAITSEFSDVETVISGVEGKRIAIYTYKYERNPNLRKAAIKKHGYTCKSCGFDFEKVYGELGKEFIEVHHIKPLYTLEKEVEINPETDLIPLCSNCHRMIHREKNKILTVEDLRKLTGY